MEGVGKSIGGSSRLSSYEISLYGVLTDVCLSALGMALVSVIHERRQIS